MTIKEQFYFLLIVYIIIPICVLMYCAIFKWNNDFNENSTKKEGDNNDNR